MIITMPDFVGITGVLMIVVMYTMNQLGSIKTENLWYSVLNAVGSLLILISLYFYFNLASFLIEIVWLVVSLYGVYRTLSGSNAASS